MESGEEGNLHVLHLRISYRKLQEKCGGPAQNECGGVALGSVGVPVSPLLIYQLSPLFADSNFFCMNPQKDGGWEW